MDASYFEIVKTKARRNAGQRNARVSLALDATVPTFKMSRQSGFLYG